MHLNTLTHADGARKEPEWTVFWCGVTDWDEIRAAVAWALAKKPTLEG